MKQSQANIQVKVKDILRIEFTVILITKRGFFKRQIPLRLKERLRSSISNPERDKSKSCWTIKYLSSTITTYMQLKGWCQNHYTSWEVGAFYLEASIYLSAAPAGLKIPVFYMKCRSFKEAFGYLVNVSREQETWKYIISKGFIGGSLISNTSERVLLEQERIQVYLRKDDAQ